MLAYLHRYAETFALTSRIRFDTRVDRLSRGDGGWLVEHSGTTEAFERVVVASGRFQSPVIPAVPGLDTFTGSAGATSTYHYREPRRRIVGKRVLVAGGAISALEIASELAQLGVVGHGDAATAALRPAEVRRGRAFRLTGSSRGTAPSRTRRCRPRKSTGS